MSDVAAARAFARTQAMGYAYSGWAPHRSVGVPVAFSAEGAPLLGLDARVAEAWNDHCVLVLGTDQPRVEMQGLLRAPEDTEAGVLERRMRALHAGARPLRLDVERVWSHDESGQWREYAPVEWLLEPPDWRGDEERITGHMNDDHVDAMARMARAFAGVAVDEPRLVAVDPEGLLIGWDRELRHIAFAAPARSMDDVHQATVQLARRARAALATDAPAASAPAGAQVAPARA